MDSNHSQETKAMTKVWAVLVILVSFLLVAPVIESGSSGYCYSVLQAIGTAEGGGGAGLVGHALEPFTGDKSDDKGMGGPGDPRVVLARGPGDRVGNLRLLLHRLPGHRHGRGRRRRRLGRSWTRTIHRRQKR